MAKFLKVCELLVDIICGFLILAAPVLAYIAIHSSLPPHQNPALFYFMVDAAPAVGGFMWLVWRYDYVVYNMAKLLHISKKTLPQVQYIFMLIGIIIGIIIGLNK